MFCLTVKDSLDLLFFHTVTLSGSLLLTKSCFSLCVNKPQSQDFIPPENSRIILIRGHIRGKSKCPNFSPRQYKTHSLTRSIYCTTYPVHKSRSLSLGTWSRQQSTPSKGVLIHCRSQSHTHITDNLEMPVNCGRKPEYQEETYQARGEHPDFMHTDLKEGLEPLTLKV